MIIRIWWIGLFAAAFLIASASGAADADMRLQHNPFTRPDLGTATPAGVAPAPVVSVVPTLRATLVAGAQSLANVDGELLAVGEDLDGFRLVEIGEGYVDLERGQERTRIHIQAATPARTKGKR